LVKAAERFFAWVERLNTLYTLYSLLAVAGAAALALLWKYWPWPLLPLGVVAGVACDRALIWIIGRGRRRVQAAGAPAREAPSERRVTVRGLVFLAGPPAAPALPDFRAALCPRCGARLTPSYGGPIEFRGRGARSTFMECPGHECGFVTELEVPWEHLVYEVRCEADRLDRKGSGG
jgi:hypothetical protein